MSRRMRRGGGVPGRRVSFALSCTAICVGGNGTPKSWFASSTLRRPVMPPPHDHTICLPRRYDAQAALPEALDAVGETAGWAGHAGGRVDLAIELVGEPAPQQPGKCYHGVRLEGVPLPAGTVGIVSCRSGM
jgi:hypothetical protein